MPEGDTVWLAAHHLDRALAGHELTKGELRVPQLAAVDLTGTVVREVASRGKHLLTRLADGRTLHSHLRMDGSWHLYRAGERWRKPGFEARAVLTTAERQAIGFRVHDLALLPTADEDRLVGHLGPDLLGDDWDPVEAVRRLSADPGRSVAEALLDQRNLAGLGNMYVAELLHIRGVHPWAPVREAGDLAQLVETGHRLLRANRDHPEQSTTGSLRRGETHWVYARWGQPCRRCGTRVLGAEIGQPPQQRVASWCPACQPAPAGWAPPRESRPLSPRPGRAPRER